jgi:hypothetical protein
MLFTVKPLAVVFSAIRPSKDTVTFFLIIEIVTLVFATIVPRENSLAVHFVVFPLSVEFPSI